MTKWRFFFKKEKKGGGVFFSPTPRAHIITGKTRSPFSLCVCPAYVFFAADTLARFFAGGLVGFFAVFAFFADAAVPSDSLADVDA